MTVSVVALVFAFVALLEFLTPSLAYQLRDRVVETASGRRGRTYRIALGSAIGSSYRAGTVLNQHLRDRAGYELELVSTVAPGNVRLLLDASQRIDLAVVSSVDDDAVRSSGVYGVAALEPQHFFVIVRTDSALRDVRDLTGAVNPGVRDAGHPPTLGERVLDYYGLLTSTPGTGAPVTVVRPRGSNVADFESGHMVAATRTQFLRSPLIDEILNTADYRLVPIRDHEALARSIPGARPGFIPAGLYGPGRRIPSEAVPTLVVTQLLVARPDVPGRVVRDILECMYHPRFARDAQYAFTESTGRDVGGLPLHPAATIFYGRNDLVTSDRLGRLSFVGSVLVALFTLAQYAIRLRRNDSLRDRRRLLGDELARLEQLRGQIAGDSDAGTRRALVCDADEVLSRAEQQAAAGQWSSEDIQALRSLHALCRVSEGRLPASAEPPPVPVAAPSPR
ncbi:TAXI family TRAP transporter solute-binding subunit [Luteitalea pratensis]|uniref:TAXI family TRAP transporter solute-binding subunit n=1 Tax=Luteitalea pratensis TaxID=1855912 RepID=UPI0012FF7105|nr:TAXI family TRAP transporter solute-binding subunit [Luteitalea pratensis]